MAQKLIANPYVEVNDVKIKIYGNSFVYDNGLPDINVTPLSAGGGTVDTVHGVDVTTAKGMVKFKMAATKETDDLIPIWKKNVGTNVIKFYENPLNKTLLGASCTSPREFELNASEGGIEVAFEGDPIQT